MSSRRSKTGSKKSAKKSASKSKAGSQAAARRPARKKARSQADPKTADSPDSVEPSASGIRAGRPFTESTVIRTLSRQRALPFLAGILLVAAGYLVFVVYRSYAWPAFIALLLYVGFARIHDRLVALFRGRRSLAAGAATLFVVIAVLGPVALLVRNLIRDLLSVITAVRGYLDADRIVETITGFPFVTDMVTNDPFFWVKLRGNYQTIVTQYLGSMDSSSVGGWLSKTYSVVTGGISLTAGLVVNVLFGLIILFFLFRDGPQFYDFLEEALPFPRLITERFVKRMDELIRAVLLGNVFVSILQGAAVAIGLSLCGIQNPVVYGAVAGIFSLIPIIGTSVVHVPAALYLIFAEQSYGWGIFILAWGFFWYFFLENIFKPKLLDRKLGMHPLFLFLAILGGIAEFGPTGVILGPLFVTLFMTIWTIYHIWGSSEDDARAQNDAGE